MSVVGSVSVRVVPSFSGIHRSIGQQFTGAGRSAGSQFTASLNSTIMSSTARGLVYSRAGENITRSVTGAINRTMMRTDFTRSFTTAFGKGRAIAAGEGGVAGHSWASRTASRISGNAGDITSSITQPFTGVMSDVVSVGNATGLSFVNAEASSIGASGASVNNAVMRPFSGVMSDVVSVGNATGLGFAGAASSSIAQGGAQAGQSFMSRLGDSIGAFSGRAVAAAGSVAQNIGSALQGIGGSISNVSQQLAGLSGAMSSVGGSLTKWVTLPAVGAATAVGGVAASFGWGRLVSLDTAQGKLRGLGYEASEVEAISNEVSTALEGGMMTLGEGVDAAANAMAGGIKPGKELTHYIQMLDAAGAASTGTTEEMAQIFSRIASNGSLARNEFDMISYRVAGFSQAVQDHYGVTQDAMYEMLNAGEITTSDFLQIMDDHAGDMALEYAKTWEGMVANTKNYIGMIGENLLEGVFQMSKEEIGEFIHLISDETVQARAREIGETIREVFTGVVDAVKGAIAWWNNLDGSTQKMIGQFAGLAVAAGPFLLIAGKIGGAIANIGRVVGPVVSWLGAKVAALGSAASSGTVLSGVMAGLQRVLGFLLGPIGWIVTGLTAVWVASEDFRSSVVNLAQVLWGSLVSAFQMVWGHVQNLWGSFQDLWGSVSQGGGVLDILGTVLSWVVDLFSWLLPIIISVGGYIVSGLVVALDWLVQGITWVSNGIAGLIGWFKSFGDETTQQGAVVTGVWGWIRSAISTVATWLTGTAWPRVQSAFQSLGSAMVWVWQTIIKPMWDAFMRVVRFLWVNVVQPIFGFIRSAFQTLGTVFMWVWNNIISPMWDLFISIIRFVWNNVAKPIFGFIRSAFRTLGTVFMWVWNNVIKPMWDMFVAIVRWVWNNIVQPIFRFIGQAFRNLGQIFMNIWKGFIKPVFNLLRDIILWVWRNIVKPYFEAYGDAFQRMGRWLRNVWRNVLRPVFRALGDFVVSTYRKYIRPAFNWIRERWDWLTDKISGIWRNTLKPIFQAVGDFVMEDVVGMIKKGVDWIGDAWNKVANFFRKPINWVINTVWNDGIKKAFDSVSDAVGSDARLGRIPTIGKFGGGGGSRGNIPGYAEGGLAPKGMALVGEEGPELIDLKTPGRVYTADETRAMMSGGVDGEMPMGSGLGWQQQLARQFGMSETGRAVGERVASAWDWVRGKLADGVEWLMKPILNGLDGFASQHGLMGDLGSGLVRWGVDSVVDWARGKDEEDVGGFYGGEFTANPGGFNRPMAGVISSMAGRRSYIGRYGNMHYGVDIAAPIGNIVRAAWDGVVKQTGGSGLDQIVVLNHGGFDTAYMHNSRILKSPGTQVSGGERIALSGTAGSGPHLHFEYHPGGYYNPSIGAVNSLFRDKGGLIYPGLNQVMNNTGGVEYAFNQRQFDNLVSATEQGGKGNTPNITQNNYMSHSQYRDAQDLRMVFRREQRKQKAGV